MNTETINKTLKKAEHTGTHLSSLSRADFTRFQHNIFFNPITTINTALFYIFLNLQQGDILTKAEKHFGTEGHLRSSAYLVSRWVD